MTLYEFTLGKFWSKYLRQESIAIRNRNSVEQFIGIRLKQIKTVKLILSRFGKVSF